MFICNNMSMASDNHWLSHYALYKLPTSYFLPILNLLPYRLQVLLHTDGLNRYAASIEIYPSDTEKPPCGIIFTG